MDSTDNDSKKKLSDFDLFLKPFFLRNKAQRRGLIFVIIIFGGVFLFSFENSIYIYIGIALILLSIIGLCALDAYYATLSVKYKTQFTINIWNKFFPFKLKTEERNLNKVDKTVFLANLIFNLIIFVAVLALFYALYKIK